MPDVPMRAISPGALALDAVQAADTEPAVQLDLLKLSDLPARIEVVEMIEARSFVDREHAEALRMKFKGFTGKILLRELLSNEEMATALCLALQSGMSERLVAKRFGISTHSIPRIKFAMQERGELAAIRRRVDALLDRFVEVGFETIIEALLSGQMNPNSVSIAVIAADDKRRQRDAGLVPGTERTEEDITLAKVQAQFALLKERALLLKPSEGQAEGNPAIPAQSEQSGAGDTGGDTGSTPSQGADPAPSSPSGQDAGEGRGGGPAAGGPATDQWAQDENSQG
jgi:transposase-like protein